jgi:hypothetical protein
LTDEEWKRYYQSLSEGFNAVGFSYDHQHYQDYMQTAESAGKLQVLIVSYKIMMFFIGEILEKWQFHLVYNTYPQEEKILYRFKGEYFIVKIH